MKVKKAVLEKFKLIFLISIFIACAAFTLVSSRTATYYTHGLVEYLKADLLDASVDFTITVVTEDDNSKVIPNAEFIIWEMSISDDKNSYVYTDPYDANGNVVGTRTTINGEEVSVFESDENGQIIVNLRDGIYKIEQISTKEGYIIADAVVKYFGINETLGALVELNAEEPLYTGNTDANSLPASFFVEGREDGSALYYNLEYLTYIDSNNNIVWSNPVDAVYQILAKDDGFVVLYDYAIVEYDNEGNEVSYIDLPGGARAIERKSDGTLVVAGEYYYSMTIDAESMADGNSVTFESYDYTFDIWVAKINTEGKIESIVTAEGIGDETPRRVDSLSNGNYVVSYILDSYEYSIMVIDATTGDIVNTLTTTTSANRSYDLVHDVIVGTDSSIYYGGNFDGILTFTSDQTVSGEEITLTSEGEDGLVMKLTSDLKIEWAINIGGIGGDHFFKADLTPDGGLIMGGDSDTGAITVDGSKTQSGLNLVTTPDSENVGTWRGITIKINTDGEAVWGKEFGFTANEGMYAATAFTNNSFALCGFETANGTRNAVFIRVNENTIQEEIVAVDSLLIENEQIKYNITTEVIGSNGTISGQDDTVYEEVGWGEDNVKPITITAAEGYRIKSITVEKTDDDGNVTSENIDLDKTYTTYDLRFTEVKEHIHVIVEFEQKSAIVQVNHYLDGTTTRILDKDGDEIQTIEYQGEVDDPYTVSASSDVATYYEYVSSTGNETGVYANSVIEVNFYYKVKEYAYTVEYYYDGLKDDTATINGNLEYGFEISDYVEKDKTGYKFDRVENLPLTIGEDESKNILKVYYVVDDSQTKDISYTVEYYKDGVLTDTDTVTNTVQVLDPDTLTVDKTAINVTDKYEGYVFESTEPEIIPDEVNSNDVIKVNYTKRTDLSYSVKYLEQGTNVEIATEKVVNNQTFEAEITESAIDIEGYEKVVPDTATIKIEVSGNEIIFYYTKRTDLVYEVNYYEEGTTNKVANSKVIDGQTFKASVTEEAIDIEGYNKVAPTSETITIGVTGNEINFYYAKRTDLVYEVNYYEEGTTIKVANSKIVDGQTFNTSVIEEAIDIEGYNKVAPTSETITIGVTGNEINFYYTKRTDLAYTVKYLEQGTNTEIATSKTVENQTFGDTITETAIDIEGYDKVAPETATIQIAVDGNEIVFYYTKRTDFSYRVEYYYNNVIDDSKTVTVNNQIYGAVISTYDDKIETGYMFERATTPITIGVGENIIKVFYITDPSQTKEISYSVEYYKDGTKVDGDTQTVKNIVQVLEPDTLTVDKTAINITDKYIGYIFEKTEPETIPDEIATGETIKVYYIKRTDLSYTVNYYEEGTTNKVATSKIVEGQTFEAEITETAIDVAGYNKVAPTVGTITIGVDSNEINFYYEKRTDLSYTIKYLENGTNSEIVQSKVVENQVFGDTVTENAIDIEGYNKVAPESVTITIAADGNEIIFYYTPRTDLAYKVYYLEQGTNAELAIAKTAENQTFGDTITETAIDIEGYNKVAPESATLQIGVDTNEIIFYYEKRTDLNYRVEYYYNNVLDSSKTEVVENQTYGAVISTYADKVETGYMFEKATIPITIGIGENVIKVYYISDPSQTKELTYTVNYYRDGVIVTEDTQTVTKTVQVLEPDTIAVDKTAINITDKYVGYVLANTDPSIIPDEIADGEVIEVFYTSRTDLAYTVKYLEQGTNTEIATSKTVENQTFGDTITENAIDIEGYNKVAPETATLQIAENGNEIVFYYERRTDLSYTVEYYYNNVIDDSKTETIENQTYGAEISTYVDKVEAGYMLERATVPITIGVGNNVIQIYYISDPSQTKDISYSVEYYKDGNLEETVEETQTVQLLEQEILTVDKTAINITDKYIGYIFEKTEPETIPNEIANGETIKVYYIKRSDLSYTVNYIEEGTTNKVATSKVVEGQTFEAEITESAIDVAGYNKVAPTEATIKIGVDGNEINFYYEKRTDLSYTVKYLEKDTGVELATSKVVENQTYKSVITESAIDIEGYIKQDPMAQIITIELTGNEITFYYKKVEGLTYTVNYYEEGTTNKVATSKVIDGKAFGDQVTEEAIDVEGYNKVEPTSQAITIELTGNEINFYYTKKNDLTYTVKYLEEGTLTELAQTKTVNNQVFGDIITEEAIDIEGYNKVAPENATITIAVDGNEIEFYYTKRTDLTYTVKYLEEGTLTELAQTKTVNNQVFGDIITEEAIDIEGYDKVAPENATITIAVGGNEIIFYYKKVDGLTYTVHYYEEGTTNKVADSKVVNGKMFGDSVTENAIDIEGFNKVAPETKSIIIEMTGNEIYFYYERKTDLSYTVKYLEEGTLTELAQTKTVNNQVFGDIITEEAIDIAGYDKTIPFEATIRIAVDGNEIIFYYRKREDLSYVVNYYEKGTTNKVAPQKVVNGKVLDAEVREAAIEVPGYNKVAPTEATIKIGANLNEINFYYEKRTDLSYTVKYLEKDTLAELATEKTVTGQTYKDQVTESAIEIEGYNKVAPETVTIEIAVDGNEIIFYYQERTDISYTVEYYYENIIDTAETEIIENQTYGDIIDSYEDKVKVGYKLDSATTPITLGVDNNIIKVYYVIDESQTKEISYTVEYYKNDEYAEEDVFTKTVQVLQPDVLEVEKDKINMVNRFAGYKFDLVVPGVLPDEVNDGDVIKVYYITDGSQTKEIKYTVEYYKDGVLDTSSTEEYTDEVQLLEPETLTVNKNNINTKDKFDGYKLDEDATGEIPDTVNNGDVIKIYYVRKDATVVVHYRDNSTKLNIMDDATIEGKVFDTYEVDLKVIDGYTLVDKTDNVTGEMTEATIDVVLYYAKNAKVTVQYIDKNTGELLDEDVIASKEGDSVETKQKDFTDYVLVQEPVRTTITVGNQDITVTYSYVKVSEGVIVKSIDDATGEVIDTQVISGNEGDEYITEPEEISGYDIVVSKLPANEEGVMGDTAIEVKYYYIRQTEVVVKYVDYITGKVLGEFDEESGSLVNSTETIEGHENDYYSTETKVFDGYVLVETPDNKTGVMKVDRSSTVVDTTTVVTYKYAREAKVRVEYIDIDTDEPIKEDEIISGYEDKEYSTNAIEISKYDLVQEPGNKEGTMTVKEVYDPDLGEYVLNNETVVTYKYEKKVGKLQINHINKLTNEYLEKEEYTAKVDEPYETKAKEFEGYIQVEEYPTNATGVYTEETIVVNYYYMKFGKVNVHHIDINTNEPIVETVVITGVEEQEYSTQPITKEGYVIVQERYPENTEGKLVPGEIDIYYYYIRTTKVIVSYIDNETGEKLAEDTVIEGYEGDYYSTEPKDVEFYTVEEVENPKGTMKIEKYTVDGKEVVDTETEVVYKYRKLIFDMSIEKTISDMLVNNKRPTIENDEVVKIELKKKSVNSTKVDVLYKIVVENKGELEGTALVVEDIPENMYYYENEIQADGWTVAENGKLALVTGVIKPGEKEEYYLILHWDGSREIGTFTNNAYIEATENEAGYDDVTVEENDSQASVIIVVSTGVGDIIDRIGASELFYIIAYMMCATVAMSSYVRKIKSYKK